MTARGAIFFLLILSAALPVFSWDEGFIGLTVPRTPETPLMLDIDIAHKIGNILPLGGVNARLGLGVSFLKHFRVAGTYASVPQRWHIQAAGWYPFSFVTAGGAYSLIIGRSETTGETYIAQLADIYGRASFFSGHLTTALNIQFDSYLLRMNFGLGISIGIIDLISIVGDGYISPPFSAEQTVSWGFNAGVLIKTHGHQFLLFAGSGINLNMAEVLTYQEDRNIRFGFVIRRKLDVYF